MTGLIVLALCLSSAGAEPRKALIYDIGKTKDAPRFVQETEITDTAAGEKLWVSKINDAQGVLVMTERAILKYGKITYQYVEQLQIAEAYELKVDGGKATFQTFSLAYGKKGPPVQTKTVAVGTEFMTGPMTEIFLQKQWAELSQGKSIRVEFGIFELSKAVDFKFKKISDKPEVMEIEMRPANFFISLLVEPIRIEFNKESKRMVHFKGRTPLREQSNGRWTAIDAEIIYP